MAGESIPHLKANRNLLVPLSAILLVILTSVLYWPVTAAPYFTYDDPVYILDNDAIHGGLTWASVDWAFTTYYHGMWHPLTWLSFMIEIEFFGCRPEVMHTTNLVLHLVNLLLVLLIGVRLFGATVRAVIPAALFAIHPLGVESVAWVSERKGLLCASFFLTSILLYLQYVQGRKRIWYMLLLGTSACGFMSKTVMVTFPCVLLLLDVWPLRRLRLSFERHDVHYTPGSVSNAIVEKLPIFLMAVALTIMTFYAEHSAGALRTLQQVPVLDRLSSFALSYSHYLIKAICPLDLCVVYPRPTVFFLGETIARGTCIAGLVILAALFRRTRPLLLFGLSWYSLVLFPMSGLAAVGPHLIADRYGYLALIGIFMAFTSLIPATCLDVTSRNAALLLTGGTIAIACLIGLTNKQVASWLTPEATWMQALDAVDDNFIAHHNLGVYLQRTGRATEAAFHFERADLIRDCRRRVHAAQ